MFLEEQIQGFVNSLKWKDELHNEKRNRTNYSIIQIMFPMYDLY